MDTIGVGEEGSTEGEGNNGGGGGVDLIAS